MNPFEALDELLEAATEEGAEIALELSVASECAWAGELRYTPEPNRRGKPDRSFVFYAVAGSSPEYITQRLLSDFNSWKNGR